MSHQADDGEGSGGVTSRLPALTHAIFAPYRFLSHPSTPRRATSSSSPVTRQFLRLSYLNSCISKLLKKKKKGNPRLCCHRAPPAASTACAPPAPVLLSPQLQRFLSAPPAPQPPRAPLSPQQRHLRAGAALCAQRPPQKGAFPPLLAGAEPKPAGMRCAYTNPYRVRCRPSPPSGGASSSHHLERARQHHNRPRRRPAASSLNCPPHYACAKETPSPSLPAPLLQPISVAAAAGREPTAAYGKRGGSRPAGREKERERAKARAMQPRDFPSSRRTPLP